MNDFIVLFTPRNEGEILGTTADQVRAIDAWSCEDGGIAKARRHMIEELKAGAYTKHGNGNVEVVRTAYINKYSNDPKIWVGC